MYQQVLSGSRPRQSESSDREFSVDEEHVRRTLSEN